jgi:hypothetical protein
MYVRIIIPRFLANRHTLIAPARHLPPAYGLTTSAQSKTHYTRDPAPAAIRAGGSARQVGRLLCFGKQARALDSGTAGKEWKK